jgi:hypothetical protein
VKEYRASGLSVKAAVARAAKALALDADELTKAYLGKRSATRRARKRHFPTF